MSHSLESPDLHRDPGKQPIHWQIVVSQNETGHLHVQWEAVATPDDLLAAVLGLVALTNGPPGVSEATTLIRRMIEAVAPYLTTEAFRAPWASPTAPPGPTANVQGGEMPCDTTTT